jgi:hypothetical protein
MTAVVEVVDSIMGSHKTTKIIEWMESNTNERYIYISPLLSEVGEGGRLSQAVEKISFEYPSSDGAVSKCESLLRLLQDGANISCTHSLYMSLTEAHLSLIEDLGYILVIDEEVDVIDGFDRYSKDDYLWLYKHQMISHSENDGMVSWVGDPDVGAHSKYYMFKQYCDSQCLYVTKRSNTMMVTQLPVRLMTVAKRVIVLTYMFEGNTLSCFLKLKGIETKKFTEVTPTEVDREGIRKLVNLLPLDRELSRFNPTGSWYERASKAQLDAIAKHIRNVGNRHKASFEDLMYTLPKDRHVGRGKNLIKPVGYYKRMGDGGEYNYCWLATQTRATNDYAHKSVLVHCYDRYPLVSVDSYLSDYGCPVDRQVFALSELLQWIWRSRIRNGSDITVSITSKRMYNLFKGWLEADY